MSTISAGTTLTTALVQTGDTNGNLVFKTGASGTTALTLGSDQSATFAGAINFTGGTLTNPTINGNVTTTGLNFDSNTFVIDATNNRVGVNIATPAVALDVYSPADSIMFNLRENTSGNGRRIRFSNAGTVNTIESTAAIGATNLAFTIDGNEAMRIDSSRNVGIGTSSPAQKLHVASAGATAIQVQNTTSTSGAYFKSTNTATSCYFGVDANGGFVETSGAYGTLFYNNGTERMRIDSSGNLLVGTASGSNALKVVKNQSSNTAIIQAENTNNTAGNFAFAGVLGANCNNNTSAHFGGTSGASAWYLLGNGTTSYSSDSRLKKNIETARNGYLEDLCQLRVVKYNWANHDDSEPKELGLIAQEVEQVFPNLVQDDLRGEFEGVTYKTLKGSVIPMMMLKAIQELKSTVDAQAERIKALENK